MASPYQPAYHFFPGEGFMNDPNGLIYYEGTYHLFYQYGGPKYWGHAVSANLVDWQILPMALEPDMLGDIWSGSVVLDKENTSGFFSGGAGLVAIFTHQNGQQSAPLGPQIQSIAYSHDQGRSWSKYEQNPVITNPGINDFRDPQVFWHTPTQAWVMVVVMQDRIRIYRSPNLREWQHASDFSSNAAKHGVWECPNLLEMPVDGQSTRTQWLLHVSLWHRKETFLEKQPEMQYFLGNFDGYTFTTTDAAETVRWSDYGKDNYAAIAWSDIPAVDGRLIWIGWCNNWCYAERLPTGQWQGIMTIPRTLELKTFPDQIKLIQQPIIELEQLRREPVCLEQQMLTPQRAIVLPIQSAAVEIIVVFRLATASEFGLQVRKGQSQQTVIGYEVATSEVFVDRRLAGESAFDEQFPGQHRAYVALYDDTLKLHIFVDHCSVEVFAQLGEVVISDLIFPDLESQGILLYTKDGEVELCSLEIYSLKAIAETGIRI